MRAASAADLPTPTPTRALIYQPKWDGYRALAWTTHSGVALQSRHGKDLTGYFPDVCRALAAHLPPGLVIDGELIVWDDVRGRTSFAHLQRRLTAGRWVAAVAATHPAHFVAFDLLQDLRGRELLDQPLTRRRRRLERLLAAVPPELPICPQTTDEHTAQTWFDDWSATGIEGLVVKNPHGPYQPGQIGWVKVKTRRTEEMIIGGVTGTIAEPGSLLLGRLDRRGVLRFLTHTHRLRAPQRRELAGLQPMAFRGDGSGHPWPCPLPAAWTGQLGARTSLPYTQVEPTLVAEIDADIATDGPFDRPRHPTRMLRVRPDLHPCDIARL
jgi:ATP-dependent DNA ligase